MKVFRTKSVKMPTRAHSNDAGIDIFIPDDFAEASNGVVMVMPGESLFIPAGIKINVPKGHALIAFNKSGVAAKKSLVVGACVIDESYQGEIHIDLKNVGGSPQILKAGDKITQLVCLPINYVEIEESISEEDCFNGEESERGDGGFGSTGTN